jgi:DNA-binding CsgD family transcriptional regulator
MAPVDRGSDRLASVILAIYDAALAPERWPDVLISVAQIIPASSAAYIIWNRGSKTVEWASFSSPNTDLPVDYVRHYATLNPFLPLVAAAPTGSRLWLSEALPQAALRDSKWYNDFFLPRSGGGDILGIRLFETPSHAGLLCVRRGVGAPPISSTSGTRLRRLVEALSIATRTHDQLRGLGLRMSVALRALDRLNDVIVVTNDVAQVVEMNLAAKRMLQLDDGLTMQRGQLRVKHAPGSTTFAKLVAAAATSAESGRMLVERDAGRLPICLTVVPLSGGDVPDERRLAMVVLGDADQHAPSERELAQLFNLTPAESRLAAALVAGHSPNEIAVTFNLQITTLRTQIRAILRKVGVHKLTDFARVVSSITLCGLTLI